LPDGLQKSKAVHAAIVLPYEAIVGRFTGNIPRD
jgi:hypothetical protein